MVHNYKVISGERVCRTGGGWAAKYGSKIEKWDIAPDKKYFDGIFRVSKHCIIWGGNYFPLPPNRNFIIFNKTNIPDNFSLSQCEYAWTNIKGNSKLYNHFPNIDHARTHPTQKPIALYKWLLSKYAQPDWKILDTHLGSGTHAIACYDMGFSLTACEIDEDYFNAAVERLRLFAAQGTLEFEVKNA
jgi:site-specific DNA-methyltransferase (adenine-specific)